ncbi:ABC transporter substrate-binding protein [Siccirubricoccus deserti]
MHKPAPDRRQAYGDTTAAHPEGFRGRRAAALARAEAADPVLRVGTTLADIPLTTGQPSQGGEGQRFIGYQLYDCLINWDLSKRDIAARHRPGLALSWEVDRETRTVWTFRLRPGVTFHDGSAFTADDVVWNLDKLMRREAPHSTAPRRCRRQPMSRPSPATAPSTR